MAFRDPFFTSVKRKAEDMVSSESDGSASGEGSEAGAEEVSETANEKRVRLARAMIETVRGDSEDPEEEENVSKRLQKLAAAGAGGRGLFVAVGAALARTPCEWGAVRESVALAGHVHAPTCLVVQGGLVASGAKGGRLLVHSLDGQLLFEAPGNGKNDVKALCWAAAGVVAVARRGAAAVELWRTEGPAAEGPAALLACGAGGAAALCGDGAQLYAAGEDGTLRAFDVRSGVSLGVHFGHQQRATGAVCLGRDRVLTCSEDKTVRLWRLEQSQQAVFRGPRTSIDCVVAQVKGTATLGAFCSGQQDGSLCLWSAGRRKPLCSVPAAHGGRWIVALAHLRHSDLLASGSYDGFVRLWRFAADLSRLEEVAALPAPGFVNGLALEAQGPLEGPVAAARLLVALGREHRLGRWWSARRDAAELGPAVCDGATDELYCYPLLLPVPQEGEAEEEEEEKEEEKEKGEEEEQGDE